MNTTNQSNMDIDPGSLLHACAPKFLQWIGSKPREVKSFVDWVQDAETCAFSIICALEEAVEWGLPSSYEHWNNKERDKWANHLALLNARPCTPSEEESIMNSIAPDNPQF